MRNLIVAAVLTLAALPAAAQDSKIIISKEAWQGFQDFKGWIGGVGAGFFAVSKDGTAWGSSGCQDSGCSFAGGKEIAITECQKHSNGVPCLIFAQTRDVLVPYEIAH